MNILPKKSWHVRNKDNIERVRRDEAQAAAEEKDKQRRIALAESEVRLDKLRGEASKGTVPATSNKLELTDSGGHLNLFAGEEQGLLEKQANKEHEEEAKKAQEKWEKSVGILTYLGQSSTESLAKKPWYFKPPSKESKSDVEEGNKSCLSSKIKGEFDRKTKSSLDPMNQMGKYLDIKRKQKEENYDEKHNKTHKHKKHKHSKTSSSPHISSSGKKTIQELRAERVGREREERLKAERLLAKHRGEDKVPPEKTGVTDERKLKYNSQFNPDFVRTYKPSKRDYY